ncbi:TonB-linked SusC/RagA family outer membrane protein [Pedobacter psychrotolerans]|uniref:SusC/RagA family TonB-linked outer membrane protein n=1 Tax=Pedobacter psychrotolerans TaxID=1843235 RepID=A0A4V2RYD2_9SPHI|nr:TonB-dependent receptor [Pedobacter psychrotolerans]TCO19356.1 TonB-linked SusC/RagA family outer membrane protein [Pedobacter psychrotolerans]GGE69229.1 SusC/RagA family TonB-linked outer membrane protein [Pedobacter psychrotolerans]
MSRVLLFLSFLTFFGFTAVQAQNRQLTGTVKDKADGQALVGVSVTVKDSKSGVSTDANGGYKVAVSGKGAVITFAYVGYKTRVVTLGDQSKLDITLEEDANNLQEVTVNIGYGSVRKEALTGAVSSVSGKDIEQFPVSTAAQALAGKLAGVSVTTTEGSPGAEVVIKVRGGSSLTGDNSPLYIVDGIQVENALSILSPNEIQSIDVLKDVASTSIYGSRGANGVVIITTKSGKPGKPIISFDAYAGSRQIVNKLDVMNPYEFVKYQYELYNNNTAQDVKDSFTKRYGTFEDLDIYKNIQNIDWQDKVFGRQAFSHTEVLNLSGGSKKTTYNVSVNNTDEDGIMLNSGFTRTFASVRLDHKFTDKLRVGINARYSRQRVDGIGTTSTGSQGTNRLRNSVRYQPYSGGSDSGDLFDADYLTTGLSNPITLANQELKYDYRNDLISSAYAQYSILKNLTFKSTVGYNRVSRHTNTFNGPVSNVARNSAGLPAIQLDTVSQKSFINTNTLSYKPDLGKNHSLDILVGQEINMIDIDSRSTTTKFFPIDISAEDAFKSAVPPNTVQDRPTSLISGTRQFSLFSRLSYAFKNKYLATVNFRTDASSLFAEGKQWGYFPSAQVAWRVTEEKFIKDLDLDWLENFKVRMSYGAAGNNRIGQDLFRTLFYTSSTTGGYADRDNVVTPGLISGTATGNILSNPNITWETNLSKNLGIDIDLFKNRLSLNLDYYDNRTKNLLLNANVPQTTGYATQQQNVGKTQNKGFELQLNYQAVKTQNFNYTTSFNISFNSNKIVELQNGVNSYITQSGWVNSLGDFKVEVGQPVGQFYGFISDGRYTVDDFTYVQNATTGAYTYTLKPTVANSRVLLGSRDPQPGDMKVKKLSSSTSMMIGDDDRTVLGNSQPKFTGGFNNQFAYKNFDMTVFVNFSYGSKVYNANKIEFTSQYNVKDNNLLSVMNDRWQNFDENGVKVTDPNLLTAMNANTTMWTPTTGNYALTSYAIESGSFLRISNVTLGYTLPQKLMKRTGFISKLRVYGTVNNLYTITGYTGYDPEANTRRSNPLTPGIDYAAYPRSRYILAGINMVF